MVAAIFEAPMSREQADELAARMAGTRDARPTAVLNASLLYDDGVARLIAIWTSKDALDRYLSVTPVPRGVELMREVGAEPVMRVVPALEFG
jgi:hypothetical protein